MSNYHFGDDYDLNYYPQEASDSMGGVDWDKVESVEIKCVDFVRKPDDKSRWHKLFGTPEKVADYFATQCMGGDGYTCEICPFTGCDGTLHADTHPTIRAALLEWLEGANE